MERVRLPKITVSDDFSILRADTSLLSTLNIPERESKKASLLPYLSNTSRKTVERIVATYDSSRSDEPLAETEIELHGHPCQLNIEFSKELPLQTSFNDSKKLPQLSAIDCLALQPDPAFIIDQDGKILEMNREARFWLKNFGFPPEVQHFSRLYPVDSMNESMALFAEKTEKVLQCTEDNPSQLRWKTTFGSPNYKLVPAEVYIKAFPQVDDSPPLIFMVIQDRTQQATTKKDLLRAKELAEKANRAKSDFLASMSHEIRTPITSILGYSELLSKDDKEAVNVKAYSLRVFKNAQYLLDLINDILDLAKVESRRMSIATECFDLGKLARQVANSLECRCHENNVQLDIVIDPSFQNRFVVSDPIRVRQVLINLIGNAIKFTTDGAVTVHLSETDAHTLRIGVKDTGCGIPAESYTQIFEPFRQVESFSRRRYGGTGLGLPLSQKLATMLGGRVILCHSEEGLGSEFAFYFDPDPQNNRAELARHEQGRISSAHRPETEEPLDLQGIQILLADDAEENRLLFAHILRKAGASVELAEDGEQAIAKALNQVFDIILMDVQMPKVDGYEAVIQLRQQKVRTPILALSAHAMASERQKAIQSGCDDHISKPVRSHELIRRIREWVHRHSQTIESSLSGSGSA